MTIAKAVKEIIIVIIMIAHRMAIVREAVVAHHLTTIIAVRHLEIIVQCRMVEVIRMEVIAHTIDLLVHSHHLKMEMIVRKKEDHALEIHV